MNLAQIALGVAVAEVGVREQGGANRGPQVRKYLADCDPPLPEGNPWCAAFVQYCADHAARTAEVPNPLDDVKLEAFVQSYFDWASAGGKLVTASQAKPGDLVLFNFGGARWDHIGFVLQPPIAKDGGWKPMRTVEGNTNDGGSREGDGVYVRAREVRDHTTIFVRWAP